MTGVKLPGTGLKAVSGVDVGGAGSKDEVTGAKPVCTGVKAAGGAGGTFVPHPPQKTAVSFNAEPHLPQNLAIAFLLHGIYLSCSFAGRPFAAYSRVRTGSGARMISPK
jgi:hypothetical protein